MGNHRIWGVLGAAVMLLSCGGCKASDNGRAEAQFQEKISRSFQTTAKVKYQELETVMTIYKKPMNCAMVTFESPESLRDMKMTFYTDRVALEYKGQSFDFVPDSVPGQAASKLVLSAINTAMEGQGIRVEQKDGQLLVHGKIEQGDFSLVVDAKDGNILKLSIPQSQLELEVLNFKILE